MWLVHIREGKMSYWPIVTIVISLILILFFRRLDKRLINFQKFKRYSDKLMADFEAFLKQRREELGKGLGELDGALSRAAELIRRIEATQENLKDSQGNLQKERDQIQSIKNDLENLKDLKRELSGEIKGLETSLPSLKKLNKRIQRIEIETVEHEKTLRNVSSLIPSFEQRIQERTDKAIEELTGAVVEETKGMFLPVIQEYRENLDLLRESHEKELGQFTKDTKDIVKEAGGKVDELMKFIERCNEKVLKVEKDHIQPIEERMSDLSGLLDKTAAKIEAIEGETADRFIKKAEDGYKQYVQLMDEYSAGLKGTILNNIEERAKDLSSYIARLEGRVQGLLQDIKNETDKYGEVLELKAKSHESEAGILKSRIVAEINEEANKNLLLIKPIVSEMNEKFVSYKKEFSAILEKVTDELESNRGAIEGEIETFNRDIQAHKDGIIQELEERLREMGGKLTTIGEHLMESVDHATQEVKDGFIDRLKEYEERVVALEGRVGNLRDIARTGQRMIEEKIEKVFSDYKPEIEEKIKSLREATEELIAEKREAIFESIEGIIGESEEQLGKREQEINELLKRVENSMQSSSDSLKSQEDSLLESINSVRLDARDELIRELENLKAIFKEEGERTLDNYKKSLSAIQEQIKELNQKTEGISISIDKKIEESIRVVEGNVQEFEKNYLKTEDEIAEEAKGKLGEVTKEVAQVKDSVQKLKEGILDEVTVSLKDFREEIDKSFIEHKNSFNAKQSEIVGLMESIAENTRVKIEDVHKESQDVLRGFEKEVTLVQERIERRTTEIEKRISSFEKESSIMKRAFRFKEKVEDDIEKLLDLIAQVKEDKKDILSLRKVIQTLKRDEGDIAAKVRQLKSEKRAVQDIAKNAEQAIGLITVVDEKIQLIDTQKESLENIEEGMKRIEERFGGLEGKADELSKREKDLEVSIETIAKTKDFLSNLEERTGILQESFKEIKSIEEDVRKRVSIVDEKSQSLMGNERRIEEVLSRFKEMDALVADIEARTNQLQSTREWLARTESRLTNLAQNAERLVKELQNLSEAEGAQGVQKGGKTQALSREAQSKVKTVLTLFEQKWTIPEICKVTKMSRGEVELILELNNR
jgi:DNA repair exonuclease SbcCD ATPase subunit